MVISVQVCFPDENELLDVSKSAMEFHRGIVGSEWTLCVCESDLLSGECFTGQERASAVCVIGGDRLLMLAWLCGLCICVAIFVKCNVVLNYSLHVMCGL